MTFLGRVYTIVANGPNNKVFVYIGSTLRQLAELLAEHETKYAKFQHSETDQKLGSFRIFGLTSYRIELEKELECNDVDDLLSAEQEAYIKYKSDPAYIVTNVNVPSKDTNGKDSIKKYHASEKGRKALSKANAKYYEKNKEEKQRKMRERYYRRKQQAAQETV